MLTVARLTAVLWSRRGQHTRGDSRRHHSRRRRQSADRLIGKNAAEATWPTGSPTSGRRKTTSRSCARVVPWRSPADGGREGGESGRWGSSIYAREWPAVGRTAWRSGPAVGEGREVTGSGGGGRRRGFRREGEEWSGRERMRKSLDPPTLLSKILEFAANFSSDRQPFRNFGSRSSQTGRNRNRLENMLIRTLRPEIRTLRYRILNTQKSFTNKIHACAYLHCMWLQTKLSPRTK